MHQLTGRKSQRQYAQAQGSSPSTNTLPVDLGAALFSGAHDSWAHHPLSFPDMTSALHQHALVHPALHAQLPVSCRGKLGSRRCLIDGPSHYSLSLGHFRTASISSPAPDPRSCCSTSKPSGDSRNHSTFAPSGGQHGNSKSRRLDHLYFQLQYTPLFHSLRRQFGTVRL